MICSRNVFLGAVMAAVVLFAGCTTSPLSRIDSDRALYESWPLDVQEAVLEGKVVKDMTPEQVEMSVGKPKEKTVRNARQGMEEVWIYRQGGGPNLGGVTVGGSVGGIGVVQQGGRGGNAADEFEVVFVDGRVVRSTLP